MLLGLLQDLKKCETCGRRLEIWIGFQELEKMYGIIGADLGEVEIVEKFVRIFNVINKM